MPRGVPTLGGKVLGTIKPSITDLTQQESAQFETPEGQVSLTEPPPPWEVEDHAATLSDARRFVEVPAEWELRWINPRLIETEGWRHWKPVMASDPKVKVLVESLVTPENNIRRGGPTGDILSWMYKSWVMARRKQVIDESRDLVEKVKRSPDDLRERSARGEFGQHVRFS